MVRLSLLIVALLLAAPALAAPPEANMALVVERIESELGESPDSDFGGCPNENFCEIFFGPVQIQFLGLGIVDVLPTGEVSPGRYAEFCAATFGALSGFDRIEATEVMASFFLTANARGKAEGEIGGIEVEVAPDFGNFLACKFFAR